MNKTAILKIKGAYYYKVNDLFHKGLLTSGMELRLEHHPDNPYDKNAVAVISKGTGLMLGHLSKKVAPKYARIVNNNRVVKVTLEKISEINGRIDVSIRVIYIDDVKKNQSQFWQSISKMPTVSGVYAIINLNTGRQYIGSSTNIKNRIKSHISDLSRGSHANNLLQSDFNQLGMDNFEAKVIEKNVPKAKLLAVESNLISSLIQSKANLYNITADGQALGFRPDKNVKAKPITDVLRDNTAKFLAEMKKDELYEEFKLESAKLTPKFNIILFIVLTLLCMYTINFIADKNNEFKLSIFIISGIISLILTQVIQTRRKKKFLQGPKYSKLIRELNEKLAELGK